MMDCTSTSGYVKRSSLLILTPGDTNVAIINLLNELLYEYLSKIQEKWYYTNRGYSGFLGFG